MPAVAYVDGPPPKEMRGIVGPSDLAEGHNIEQSRFDTVILVDNDGRRVGTAADEAIRNAKCVAVVDHHDVVPTHETLGLHPDVGLAVWKCLKADAAAIMCLALLVRASGEVGVEWDPPAWSSVLEPFLLGAYSDTRGFDSRRTRGATMALLSEVLRDGNLDVHRVLDGFSVRRDRQIMAALEPRLREREERFGDLSLGLFMLPGRAVLKTWEQVARTPEGQDVTVGDVYHGGLSLFEDWVERGGLDVGLLLSRSARSRISEQPAEMGSVETRSVETPPRSPSSPVRFSVRTPVRPVAAALARRLGGDGKLYEAGGSTTLPVGEILSRARTWMHELASQ